MMGLLKWLRARRESKRLALIAASASLVIQQHSQSWEKLRPCPNCTLLISETANFCQMCGYSFVPELPSEPPVYRHYEIERHTTGMRPVVIPKRPKHDERITSLIRTQHQVPRFPAQVWVQSRKQKGQS